MTREEFYNLTDILNTEVLGSFMHGGEADELIAMFEEAVEHSNILEQKEPVSEWHDASDEYPFSGKEIIVLRDNKIYYGKYIGGFHRYVRAEIQLTYDTAQTYAIIDYLTEKDKWMYVEDLLKLSNVETQKEIEL